MGFFDERKKNLKNRSNLGANNQSVFFQSYLIFFSTLLAGGSFLENTILPPLYYVRNYQTFFLKKYSEKILYGSYYKT